jgi:hypothetical protein
MNNNLAITKIVLGITVAALISSSAFAAQKRSRAIQNPVTVIQGGLYHNDVLPNGTVTGPLGPHANGG